MCPMPSKNENLTVGSASWLLTTKKNQNSSSLALCEWKPPGTDGLPRQGASNTKSVSTSWRHHVLNWKGWHSSLQWRHNERLRSPASRLFTQPFIRGPDQRKHQSSASLAFVRGIHLWPVNHPHKGPVTRKMFPFDDVNMLFYRIQYDKRGLGGHGGNERSL